MSEKNNNGFLIGFGSVIAAAVLIAFISFMSVVSTYNNHNRLYQGFKEGKSKYSAALNTSPQKIKAVWAMAQQYLDHEAGAFRDYAAARNQALGSIQAFQETSEKAGDAEALKKAQVAMRDLQRLQQATLAVNVQIEAVPQLRGVEATKGAMRTAEEGVNEVKTALDDWVVLTRQYNAFAGNFWPSLCRNVLFGGKFPSEIPYYEGDVQKLDVDVLNPVK
jgi:hypothetical protein